MFTTSSTRPHEGLLTIAMAAVLVLAVLGAWWLSWERSGPTTAGSDLLRDLRAEGLAAYMPAQPAQAWYLRQGADGTPVGWRAEFVEPAEGGYTGKTLLAVSQARQQEVSLADWSIDAGASKGEYQATLRVTGPRAVVAIVTDTILDGPKLTVLREAQGPSPLRLRTQTDTPPNYIPEGLQNAVMRLVCRRGKTATFRMIFDQESLDQNGQLHFVRATMAPVDGNQVRCTFYSLSGSFRSTYWLDAEGQVLRVEISGGVVERRVDRAEVIRHFPEAAQFADGKGDLGEAI